MIYMIINNTRYNLIDAGVDCEPEELRLTFFKENHTFEQIDADFSNIDVITIYGCVVQEDGRETDEYVVQEFDVFTKLVGIFYDKENELYTIRLVEPNVVDQRLTALEKKAEELPPLTSPFTTNLEPTGVATRYYDVTELIAIYNKNQPITVKVTVPISYKQPIIIDLNCELYLGGN